MRTSSAITLAAIVSAGTIAAIAPTISADERPAPALFVECPPQWVDVGDGYGGFWCETTWSCPGGTFVDHNANGTVDYGECMIGQNAAQGTSPTWDYGTNPGQATGPPATHAPATDPPASAPAPTTPATDPTTPAGTTPATQPAAATPTAAPVAPSPPSASATTVATPIDPGPTLVPNVDLSDPADLPPSEATLTITTAEVLCNGLIHVEYDTAANPAPAAETSHLIVFNPSANVVDFHAAEFPGQGPNGSFTFEQLGSIDDTYRVFVTVVFDPATPGSTALTSWADAAVGPDC